MYRRWKKEEDELLIRCAGFLTTSEIAGKLERSERSVSSRARVLKQQGKLTVSLRAYKPKTKVCPECGKDRSRFIGNRCVVCDARSKADSYLRESINAWDAMSDGSRTKSQAYLDAQGGTIYSVKHTGTPPDPPRPKQTFYQTQRGRDMYAIALEEYELTQAKHDIAAYKMRAFRWRKKKDA